MERPVEFAEYLSGYSPVLYDGWCGEPTAWGFKIRQRMGEDKFSALSRYMTSIGGGTECVTLGEWVAVVTYLKPQEAIEKYGAITEVVTGPRGGFRTVKYGEKKFVCKRLDPRRAEIPVDPRLIRVEK